MNKFLRTVIISVSFLFFVSSIYPAIIYLKDGRKIEGRIVEETDDYVKIDFHGVILTHYKDRIERIENFEGQSEIRSSSFSDIFEKVSPAVVVITAYTPEGVSRGSGFIVKESGVVVTNFHVVAGATGIEIKLKDGRIFSVKDIIDYNIQKDICILKIEADTLPVCRLGDSRFLRPGDKVLVIGAPLGLEYSITDGLLSAKRKLGGEEILQFSAPVSPGNSGGPLLNSKGEVVGVTTFIRIRGQNLNFAVSINEVKPYIRNYPKMSIEEFSQKVSKVYFLYLKGRELCYQGRFQEAIEILKEVINANPEFVEAHLLLGEIYALLGRIDEKIGEWMKVLSIDPDNFEAHLNLGIAYSQKGLYDTGIEEIRKAISIRPNDASAYDNLGVTYERVGLPDTAIIYHKKAIEIDPYYQTAYVNLGSAYIDEGMYQEAIKVTKKALLLNPNDGMAHNNLAVAYYALGEYQLAVKHCNKAIALGFNVHPEFLKALEPYRKNSLDEGGFEFENIEFTPEVKDLLIRGQDAFSKQEYHLAYKYHKEALSKVRENTLEYFFILKSLVIDIGQLGINYFKKGFYEEAVKCWEEVINLSEGLEDHFFKMECAYCYYHLGLIYNQRGYKSKARECLRKLRSLHIKDPDSDALADELEKLISY